MDGEYVGLCIYIYIRVKAGTQPLMGGLMGLGIGGGGNFP